MFVFSVHKRQVKLCILIACIVAVAIAFFVVSKKGVEASNNSNMNLKASTAEERIAYLSQFGWSVLEDPVEVKEVIIPETFDDTYTAYNELQKSQGFDLSLYAARRVKCWTYQVTNYPGYENRDCIHANLLVYDGQVIGGDVSSTELDGFMHGFVAPGAENTTQQAESTTAAG